MAIKIDRADCETTLMKNHLYIFEGKTRVQKEGGSIGMAKDQDDEVDQEVHGAE